MEKELPRTSALVKRLVMAEENGADEATFRILKELVGTAAEEMGVSQKRIAELLLSGLPLANTHGGAEMPDDVLVLVVDGVEVEFAVYGGVASRSGEVMESPGSRRLTGVLVSDRTQHRVLEEPSRLRLADYSMDELQTLWRASKPSNKGKE